MKSLLTEILRDFHDYENHFLVDEEVYEDYAQKIIDALLLPCGMTAQEAYKRFDLNKTVIHKGQNENILSKPLSYADEIFFQTLKSFWAKSWFIRPQIKRHSKQDQQRLLDAPEFDQKWERQVFYWYFSQDDGLKDERHQVHSFSQITVKAVLLALSNFYPSLFDQKSREWMYEWEQVKALNLYEILKIKGVATRIKRPWPKKLIWLKQRIKTIRKKAQQDRYELKKRGKTQGEILEQRGIKKADLSVFENSHKKISYDTATRLRDNHFEPNNL